MVPFAPVGPLVVSDITSSSVTITWRPPTDTGGLSVSAYIIERRDVRYSAWLRVEKLSPGITSYCIQNLIEGNKYFFRIYAENDVGLSEPLLLSVPVLVQGAKGLGMIASILPNLTLISSPNLDFLFHI